MPTFDNSTFEERTFWDQAYLTALKGGASTTISGWRADEALNIRRERFGTPAPEPESVGNRASRFEHL